MRNPIDRATQVVKQGFKVNRTYQDAKKQLVEESITKIETKAPPWSITLFLSLTILAWLAAVFSPNGFEKLYNSFGFYPVIAVLFVSYFTIFSGSKIIFKPSAEELSDDTSSFALFSACERKEKRSLISILLGLLHTLIFVLYLIQKNT